MNEDLTKYTIADASKDASGVNIDIPTGDDSPKKEEKGSDRILVYSIAFLVVFLLIFAFMRNIIPEKEVPLTIEDAHRMNIEGKLDPVNGYMYGPHSFIRFNDMWYFQVQSENVLVNVPLRFGPQDVLDIPLHGSLNDNFNDAVNVYIAFNPLGRQLTYIALGVGELTQSLVKAFGNNVTAVCDHQCDYEACSACEGRPVLNCSNTDEAIIHLIESEESKITMKGNCVEIEGSGEDIVKNVDRLLLEFYGVFKTEPIK